MNILWTDKYAPKSLSHLVLNPETKELLQNFVANKNIPNLIFYSEAGRGKTTLAKILEKKGAPEILTKHGVPCISCPMAAMEIGRAHV